MASPASAPPSPSPPSAQGAGTVTEYLFKILVIGEPGVGKSSLVRMFVHGQFTATYKMTVGVDFGLRILSWDNNTSIKVQLWDICGQERFANMTRVYYREAVGALLVADLTRPKTLQAAQRWKEDVDAKVQLPDGAPIPVLLVANKQDLLTGALPEAELDAWVQAHGAVGWHATSAKALPSIEKAVHRLLDAILARGPAPAATHEVQAPVAGAAQPKTCCG